MAGSYGHCVDDQGRLLSNEDLVGMLENGGDVYEAIEELFGMVWYLAETTTGWWEEGTGTHFKAPADRERFRASFVEDARKNYREGLAISRGENDDDD